MDPVRALLIVRSRVGWDYTHPQVMKNRELIQELLNSYESSFPYCFYDDDDLMIVSSPSSCIRSLGLDEVSYSKTKDANGCTTRTYGMFGFTLTNVPGQASFTLTVDSGEGNAATYRYPEDCTHREDPESRVLFLDFPGHTFFCACDTIDLWTGDLQV